MAIGSINNNQYLDPLLFKTTIKFVVDEKINKQVVNIENNEVIREVPPNLTSQILTKLYG